MSRKIKFLYLSASPNDQQKLRVDKEFREIYEKVDRNSFEMISVSGTQASDIQAEVLKNNPDIVHFSGHAFFDEMLFENSAKESQRVPKNAIVNFFNNLDKKPQLIFFNACRTAENLESLSRIIDFVVVTQRDVFDDTAIIFATKFYEFLSLGKTVETAFNHAMNEPEILSITRQEKREASFNPDKNKPDIKSSSAETEVYKLFMRGENRSLLFPEEKDEEKIVDSAEQEVIVTKNENHANTMFGTIIAGKIVNLQQHYQPINEKKRRKN